MPPKKDKAAPAAATEQPTVSRILGAPRLSRDAQLGLLVTHLTEKPQAMAVVQAKIAARDSYSIKGHHISGNLLREGLWRASAGAAAPVTDHDISKETLAAIGHASAAPNPIAEKRKAAAKHAAAKRAAAAAEKITALAAPVVSKRLRS